ncbi:MAG TPA: hypothetical protein VN937_04480 [Blastocatellia bacterium]|nr:hypothetical protein [Blastocatellia bacterium]
MYVQTGKTFIATVIAVILSLGGIAVLSNESHKDASAPVQTQQIAQTTPDSAVASNDSSSNSTNATASTDTDNESRSGYEEGYKAGYRDGHQDCTASAAGAVAGGTYYSGRTRVTRAYYPRRAGVAGTRYVNTARRGHSTRNMILTIAGPAAVAAGIGGIVHGGKGAGIGALLGGGGGALYYLAKHRR